MLLCWPLLKVLLTGLQETNRGFYLILLVPIPQNGQTHSKISCLSVLGHFVWLALKGSTWSENIVYDGILWFQRWYLLSFSFGSRRSRHEGQGPWSGSQGYNRLYTTCSIKVTEYCYKNEKHKCCFKLLYWRHKKSHKRPVRFSHPVRV